VLDFSEIEASQTYFLRIAAGGPGGSNLGNYVFVADFIHENPDLAPIGSGTLTTAAQRDVQRWHVERTLLYRFDLRPEGGAPGAAQRFEIVDREGVLIASLVAPTGGTSTNYVWLPAGSFDFVLRADAPAADGFTPIGYSLSAAALSDDVGPGLVDSTESLLPGDADRSGVVDRGDVAAVAADYGSFAVELSLPADFDGDGDVDLDDLVTVATNLGRALLPDLFTSASTGTGSAPGSASAIVFSSAEVSAIDAANTEDRSLAGVRVRRSARSSSALSASNSRLLWHRLVDIAVGQRPQSGESNLSAVRDAAVDRRRRSV
jgi:hypothetical protein